ncbi:porin [Serratia symbiotica str. 'Cinara cedri']|nr:porin [Serratia symbiotica str. 'Cinara cedri']
MKRNILAVVIPALLATSVVNAAEIYNKDGNKLNLYGNVAGLHYFSKDRKEEGAKSYAYLGFKGETQITDQLAGYGQWEYSLETNPLQSLASKSDKTRLGLVGLKFADYGSLDYGRGYGILYNVKSWTTSLPEFGSDIAYSSTDNLMSSRANGVTTYRNNNFFGLIDGLNFALQYQGKNVIKKRDLEEQNGEGWGISSIYNAGEGISVGAAYVASQRTEAQKTSDADIGRNKAEAWTLGTKYDANNIYLAVMYAENRNIPPFGKSFYVNGISSKTYNFGMTAQYQFDFGLRPAVSYMQAKSKHINTTDTRNKQDLIKYVSIGSTYAFNKNMSTYVDYKINLLSNNQYTKITEVTADNIVALGLLYQF